MTIIRSNLRSTGIVKREYGTPERLSGDSGGYGASGPGAPPSPPPPGLELMPFAFGTRRILALSCSILNCSNEQWFKTWSLPSVQINIGPYPKLSDRTFAIP